MPLELTLQGAEVLGPDGLERGVLSMAEGLIIPEATGRVIDLQGFRVLPGIVDVHGDGFERHVAPRRGAMKDVAEGLRAAERELAVNGITTGVLAQFLSWEGGLRSPEFADQVFSALARLRPHVVTDLRGQARVETHLLEAFPDLPDNLARWGVGYVVLNDHLPHERLAQGRKPPGLNGQALKARRSPEKHFEALLALHARGPDVPAALDTLCTRLTRAGIRIGSHDEHTAEDRALWSARGAQVSEFPETLEAAEAARVNGDMVVMGAPNLVRGGSHKGNISAVDLIAMGLCDAIASDYHYPSLYRAALMVERTGLRPMAEAWGLVSSGPARVLGLEDRGTLEPGKRADLVIMDAAGRVAATICAGRISHMAGDVAERFLA